jgi:hypothetical protein
MLGGVMDGRVFEQGTSADLNLSARQRTIIDHLERHVSSGTAAFFRNICYLLADAQSHPALTHVVCHLLREVESGVRSVLEPIDAGRGVTTGRHRAKIVATLGVLGVSIHDPVAQFWLDLANEGPPLGLAARAHRPGLDAPRPADAEFYDFINKMEQLLERVLDRMETTYVDAFGRLDALLAIAHPTGAHADQLRNKTPNIPLFGNYFLTRASPLWLPLMRERGYFASPPAVQIDESRAVTAPWPESAYLARVASEAPDVAVEVAEALPETDNPWVNHDVVKTTLAMPASESKRLVPRVIRAMSSRFGILIPSDVGRLVSHLAAGREVDAAFEVATALLAGLVRSGEEGRTLDTHTFAAILEADLPSLVAVDGPRALSLVCNLLAETIATGFSASSGDLAGQDASHVWRESIEGDSIVDEFDPKSALAQAVWTTAQQLLKSQSSDIGQVVDVLSDRGWLIFRRIILTLLADYGQGRPDLVEGALTDRALMNSRQAESEFLGLMSAQSGVISEQAGHAVLALVREGPDLRPLLETYRARNEGKEPPEAVTSEYVGKWQLKRLVAASPILTAEAQALHDRLVLEHGSVPTPTETRARAARTIFIPSPISVDDLVRKTAEDLVTTLNEWEPARDDFLGPSRGTLSTALASAIDQDATSRSAEALKFIGLEPVYASAVINGFHFAANRRTALEWTPVVNLSAWIGRQAATEATEMTDDSWRLWRDARAHTMSLLTIGLRTQPNGIQPVCAPVLWPAVATACEDPDPDVGEEDRACAAGDTLSGLALNRVRPLAIEAAIAFGVWRRIHDQQADLSALTGIMDRELDVPADTARRSVRWVIGQYYPHLVFLDREWAANSVARIFPDGDTQKLLWTAAWNGYISYAPLSKDVFRILRGQYARAVSELDPYVEEQRANPYGFRLGVHLVQHYLAGEIELDGADGLLKGFYAKAPLAVREQLASGFGRDLQNISDNTVLSRLKELWDFRSDSAAAAGDVAELAAFGVWFGSGRFDDEWALRQLARALRPSSRLEDVRPVLARLAKLASARTSECVAVLDKWIRTEPTPWWLDQTQQDVRTVLAAGLASGNAATADAARTVINLFLMQQCDLRDLLE